MTLNLKYGWGAKFLVMLLAASFFACSSSKRLSQDGESCVRTDDCVQPLRCAMNHCVGSAESKILIKRWRDVRFEPRCSTSKAPPLPGVPKMVSPGKSSLTHLNGPPPTGLEDVVTPRGKQSFGTPAAGAPPKIEVRGPSSPPPADVP